MEKSYEDKLASARGNKKVWGRLFWTSVALSIVLRVTMPVSYQNGNILGVASEFGYVIGGVAWLILFFQCRSYKKKVSKKAD